MTDLRRALALWRRRDVVVRDLPLALVFVLASLVPALRGNGTQLGELPERPLDALACLVIALECLPLAVRRRWPAVTLALVALGFAADQLLGYHTVAATALLVALVSAGAHLAHHRRVVVALAAAAYLALAVALSWLGAPEGVSGFTTFFLVLAIAWGIGAWWRQHRRHVEESTRAAERARIARELHDVVTHHVTAMVVQAEAARYLTAAPERLDQSLAAIGDTGRRAISDLRHLLEVLSPDHGTQPRTPSTNELGTLVAQTRQAGQPVDFTEHGGPAGPEGSAEATAYRVVREALTNALKHAHGRPTAVRVHHGPGEITVEVTTDGPGTPGRSPGGSGRGLAGLRDRVSLLGGDFSAAATADGTFVVHARIPVGSAT
ncbi:signal transduction histidine kinase [Crossiella equi]|uniref:histidine kinase n=1 Tax=Crossiella equi TaxID=130796 RepID=A0ABS5A5N0_9PSEU|nr:sensor histidine kinase [Crossiella equi]MBP2471899.1 signal transduction histidine kinase [Crossiella equi]